VCYCMLGYNAVTLLYIFIRQYPDQDSLERQNPDQDLDPDSGSETLPKHIELHQLHFISPSTKMRDQFCAQFILTKWYKYKCYYRNNVLVLKNALCSAKTIILPAT
jgi:hypothetical protein